MSARAWQARRRKNKWARYYLLCVTTHKPVHPGMLREGRLETFIWF